MPSFVVSSISYNHETAILKITFVSGIIYDYKNVSEDVYLAMKTSGAKGIFLNQHIKGRYQFEKKSDLLLSDQNTTINYFALGPMVVKF